jgi:DNA-binding transcriptional LysR family regulator
VQVFQVGRGGRGDHADAHTAEEPRHEQSRQAGTREEDRGGDGLENQCGQQDRLAAHPVGHVPERDQRDDHPDGEDGEHHGHGQRPEAVSGLVERVERGGHGIERRRGQEGTRDEPEPDAVPPRGAGPGLLGHRGCSMSAALADRAGHERSPEDGELNSATSLTCPRHRVQRRVTITPIGVCYKLPVELRQLECFVAVAEESSFTRAAARLHLVQSTVSATIASLERELDVSLLLRTTRRVSLTEAGLAFLPKARSALDAVRDARDAVHAVKGGLRGTLRIGTMSSLGLIDLPELVGRFHREHPAVTVHLAQVSSGSPGLVTLLSEGRLDVAFVSLPGPPPASARLHHLTSTPLDLVVPAEHRLAGRSEVAITELADESFIDFTLGYGNRAVTDQAFTGAGISRHVAIEITDIAAGTDFIRQRLGVALLPRAVIIPDEELTAVKITGADLNWPISLALPSERSPGAAAAAFAELVVPELHSH